MSLTNKNTTFKEYILRLLVGGQQEKYKCNLCKSYGSHINIDTCPLNKSAVYHDFDKHYNATETQKLLNY